MKKILLLAAVAAFILPSCAKIDNVKQTEQNTPVSFGIYFPRGTKDTKAGAAGTITTDGTDGTSSTVIAQSLQDLGFGVFATYSDGGDYESTIGPNFMYNTKVSTSSWTYSPIKYWPNETIDDNQGAYGPSTTAADKLSFFAYAPHVGYVNDPTHGNDFDGSSETEGIIALTAKDATTDPKVTYKLSATPDKAVDLLWAVAPSGGLNYTDVHNQAVSVTAGMPLINLTKPSTSQKITFRFRHATSRLALKIAGAFDQEDAGGTLADGTKVTVEKVEITAPLYQEAVLNLKNTTANVPLWEYGSAAASTTLTAAGDNLNATIKDSGSDEVQTVAGVTASEKNVFSGDNVFFTLIPKSGATTVRVKITYYVTTADNALNAGFSRVQNVIYKDITFGQDTPSVINGFEAGKSYTIKITLGLTSVKLDASVEDWVDATPSSEIDLPANITPVTPAP